MKVVHVTSYDTGGAGKACVRLHLALLKNKVDSNLLVLHRTDSSIPSSFSFREFHNSFSKSISTRIKRKISRLIKKSQISHEQHLVGKPPGFEWFSSAESFYNVVKHPLVKKSDIINLHWVAGFIDYRSFFRNKRKYVFWTLHDMNAFTGGCHYSLGCSGFKNDCADCPQLAGTMDVNYAAKNLLIKKRSISSGNNLHIICPSEWMMKMSMESRMFNGFSHSVIRYSLDKTLFFPVDRNAARKALKLPEDKIILLFVAEDLENTRKGYGLMAKVFKKISSDKNIILCSVGAKNNTKNPGDRIHEFGKVQNEQLMNLVYSAADVFICPSLEDNHPNTIIESQMCGTPVIGFPLSGVGEMIRHGENGYLCGGMGVEPLVNAIYLFVNNQFSFNRSKIRNLALEKHSQDKQASAYMKLFNKVKK